MTGPNSWFWYALLSAIFAASTALFGKLGVEAIPSNMAVWVRILVILPLLSGLLALTGEWKNPLEMSTRTLWFLFLSGLSTGLSWLFYYRALQLGNASQVGPVDKLSVILVMIFATLFLHEKLSLKQWAGGALILTGALIISSASAKAPPADATTVGKTSAKP